MRALHNISLAKVLTLVAVGGLAAFLFFAGKNYLDSSSSTLTPASAKPKSKLGKASVVLLQSADESFEPFQESAEAGLKAALKTLNDRLKSGGNTQSPIAFDIDTYFVRSTTAPEIAAELTNKLDIENLSLLVVADSESFTAAALAAADKIKIPIFYLLDGPCKTFVAADRPSPYIWGLGFSDEILVEPLFITLNDQLGKPDLDLSMLLVGADSEESRAKVEFAKETAEDLGFKILETRFTDTRITDYYTFIRDLFASAPTVLFLNNPGKPGVLFVQQAGKLSLTKEMSLIGINTFDAENVREMGEAAERAVTIGRYPTGLKSAEHNEFLAALGLDSPSTISQDEKAEKTAASAKPTILPSETTMGAYVSLLMVDAAMRKAGSTANEKWLAAMDDLEILGPTGRILADSDNHIFHQPLFVSLVSKGGYKIVEALGESSNPRNEGCLLKDSAAEIDSPPAEQPNS